MAYKWFCGLNPNDKAPDAMTINQNRRHWFHDNDTAEKIFGGILRQYIEKGLVTEKVIYTESTHVKAKASKHKNGR